MAPQISDDLTAWAALAGYSLTANDSSGAAMFWSDPGGEIRHLVRAPSEGVVVVSSAERTLPEQFELNATSVGVVERYLFGVFGSAVRSRLNLPLVVMPRRADELSTGFELSELDADSYRSLSDARGVVAMAQGRVGSVSTLTQLSYLLSNSLEDVTASFRDREGRPLFSIR